MKIDKIGVFKDFTDNSIMSVFDLGENKMIDMLLLDIEEDIEIVSNLLNYWKINKYIQDNLVMEELYKTILKREEIVDKVLNIECIYFD